MMLDGFQQELVTIWTWLTIEHVVNLSFSILSNEELDKALVLIN